MVLIHLYIEIVLVESYRACVNINVCLKLIGEVYLLLTALLLLSLLPVQLTVPLIQLFLLVCEPKNFCFHLYHPCFLLPSMVLL